MTSTLHKIAAAMRVGTAAAQKTALATQLQQAETLATALKSKVARLESNLRASNKRLQQAAAKIGLVDFPADPTPGDLEVLDSALGAFELEINRRAREQAARAGFPPDEDTEDEEADVVARRARR